jgi:hypothetical protein
MSKRKKKNKAEVKAKGILIVSYQMNYLEVG